MYTFCLTSDSERKKRPFPSRSSTPDPLGALLSDAPLPTIVMTPSALGLLLPRVLLPATHPTTGIGPVLGKVCVELTTEEESDVKITSDAIASSRYRTTSMFP